MDRRPLQERLQQAETQARRLEENIAFQQQMIVTLELGGHDVRAASMFLRRLKAQHAKLVAKRDLANRS